MAELMLTVDNLRFTDNTTNRGGIGKHLVRFFQQGVEGCAILRLWFADTIAEKPEFVGVFFVIHNHAYSIPYRVGHP